MLLIVPSQVHMELNKNANSKGQAQPAHLRSIITPFRCLAVLLILQCRQTDTYLRQFSSAAKYELGLKCQ